MMGHLKALENEKYKVLLTLDIKPMKEEIRNKFQNVLYKYIDGGLYFNSTTVQSIVMTLCGYPTSIAVIANSIKASCVWVTAKLGAAFGPAGWTIAGALSAWVWTQAVTIAERLFSACFSS